jgi:hypothetical protein
MTMPTKEKTWLFDVNNEIITDTNGGGLKSVIFAMKQALVATGFWSVVRSSDGVSVADSDLWIDRDDIVLGTSAAARSWAILRHANFFGVGVPLDLLLEARSGSTATTWPRHFRFCVSPSGNYSGGNTTTSPTATHEISMLTPSSGADTWSFTGGTVGGVIPVIWHLMWSSDGQCFRYLLCQEGLNDAVMFIERIKNPVAGLADVDEFFCFLKPDGDYDNPTDKLNFTNFNINAGCLGYDDGTPAQIAYYMTCEYFGGDYDVNLYIGGNPDDDDSWALTPMGLVTISNAAYAYGRNGEVYDLWWGQGSPTTGSNSNTRTGHTYPNDGSRTFAQFGRFVFPWNGTKVRIA